VSSLHTHSDDKKQKKACMALARRYVSYTRHSWEHIIFSDECSIYLDDNNGRVYVTQCPDEKQVQDCLKPIFKQSSVRVMVWGCIMLGLKGH
jgi:hypothetical protein